MKELSQINSLLQQVKTITDKYNQIAEETGSLFNIFSILKIERKEVSTHSLFLYELLNPKGNHSQGCTYLNLFINKVLGIQDFNCTNVIVEREKYIENVGKMDFVIENNEQLIIIEMKIDAKDQKYQLKRYNEYGEQSNKKPKLYYLTLFGTKASEYNPHFTYFDTYSHFFIITKLNFSTQCG